MGVAAAQSFWSRFPVGRIRWRSGLVVALLLAAAPPATAQSMREPDAPIRFRHLGVEDGLSNPYVYAIYQDSLGFLWFGTEDGLNRYDGSALRVYRPAPFDTTSLNATWAVGIAAADGAEFWIAGERGVLSRYRPDLDAFSNVRGGPAQSATEAPRVQDLWVLHKARDGILWLGGRTSGLYRYDPATDSLAAFRHDVADGAGLPCGLVTALLEDQRGHRLGGDAARRPRPPRPRYGRVHDLPPRGRRRREPAYQLRALSAGRPCRTALGRHQPRPRPLRRSRRRVRAAGRASRRRGVVAP